MKSLATSLRLSYTADDKPELTLTLAQSRKESQIACRELQEILSKGKTLDVEIKQHRKKKSIDANNYCWVLCQKIAVVIGSTKELVYQEIIRRVGQFEIVPIREDAVETHIRRWNGLGLGWYAEVMDDSKLDGYKKVINYFGSSVYLSDEMAVLINEIVSECKGLDIETISPAELESLKNAWGR